MVAQIQYINFLKSRHWRNSPNVLPLFKGATVGRTGVTGRAQCSLTMSVQQAARKAGQHWALLVHKALSKLKDGLLFSQFQTSESTESPRRKSKTPNARITTC